jgi:uncharacterized PurR-regulated membrane protein YhhQ (DUF165 family)
MNTEVLILILEAVLVYFLVLWSHSLRHHFGPVHFYALIGGLTAVMSWVTDAGMAVSAFGMTFYIGSTVFYTSLLLGVFVIYVFDGPRITRVMISTIVGVSAMVPLIAMFLHMQNALISDIPLQNVPIPSFRINAASIFSTLVDLIFLAMVWEFLGKHHLKLKLGTRTFLSLLGVMWLDVLLFSTLAFAGTPDYLAIMKATLVTRLIVTVVAFPMLYIYINLQQRRKDVTIENRPVLSILKQIADIEEELTEAQAEIQRRIEAETRLQQALSEVKTLKGFIPICAGCKSIRKDDGYWERIETYLRNHSDAEFSHGMCPDCQKTYYPDFQ